jgi:hypothetical protein
MNTTHVVGATSKIVTLRAYTISTGAPYTGGAFNTATIAATYTKDGATATTITLVTATAGTWTSSGFVHRAKGVYELGAPNAAFSTTVDGVEFAIDGIADVVFIPVRVDLTGVDGRSATAPDVNVTTIASQTASAAGAVTFPGTVASPTNITAGVITTVTNLTNAPTAGDLTATMKTSVTTAATAATPVAASVTGAVGSVTAGVILAVDAIDAAAVAASGSAEIGTAVVATVVEGSITLKQAIQAVLAACAGEISGAETTTVTIRNASDTANAIVATVDADGNRSAVTYTFT